MPPNLRGILWVAISGVLFALLNVFTLIPAQHLNSYVMAFLRYFFGSLFLLPIILVYSGWSYWVFRGKVRADIGYHH